MQIPNELFPFDRTDIHQLRDFLLNQRRISGWTQEELSERSGVSVRTIRNLETGSNTNPRGTSVALLLAAFGATAASVSETVPWGGGGWPMPPAQRSGSHQSHASALPPWRGPRPLGDPLVGRQTDMRHILAATQRSRLIVLTGAGGVGKSRLAHAVAARLRPLFRDGVAVADLHDCPPEHLDPARAAAELTRVIHGLTSDDAFAGSGSQTGRRLLVLDNAEHVAQQTARIARQLLDEHPGLHLLVTSRRTLAVAAAETWEVESLRVDGQEDGDATVPSAAELFLRRVQSSLPTLDLGNHLPLVNRLCRLLDGVPLAIEIAAQRLRSLPLSSLLHDATLFHLIGQVDAGDLSRHRTLSGSVQWSYELLPPPHRALLHELARMPGTFSLDDVLTVQQGGRSGAAWVAHLLAELADASLVQIERVQQYKYRVPSLVRHCMLVQAHRPRSGGADRPADDERFLPALAGSAWGPAM
ncbi:helix-turn-helix domain-containing protein [Streptomyces sp. NPDC003042]